MWVTPFWEDNVADLLLNVRGDRLLLGSDWPHAEGVPNPVDFVTETLADLAEDDVRRVARDNAVELLGVELPAGGHHALEVGSPHRDDVGPGRPCTPPRMTDESG